jgi:hypothetical protein
MNRATRVECPVCGRLVEFVAGATNAIGAPILARHWRADRLAWEWCSASRKSLLVAVLKREMERAPAAARGLDAGDGKAARNV